MSRPAYNGHHPAGRPAGRGGGAGGGNSRSRPWRSSRAGSGPDSRFSSRPDPAGPPPPPPPPPGRGWVGAGSSMSSSAGRAGRGSGAAGGQSEFETGRSRTSPTLSPVPAHGHHRQNAATAGPEVLPPFVLPGPHPSMMQLSRPYMPDHLIQHCFHPVHASRAKESAAGAATGPLMAAGTGAAIGGSIVAAGGRRSGAGAGAGSSAFGTGNPSLLLVEAQARETSARLQGVMWIDNIRKSLLLPIKTFITACLYYHKFRLVNAGKDINCMDAAVAALLVACKIQDTLKKSKEILCAAYNLKLPPSQHVTSDNPTVEANAKSILGFERRMLEASGFDFHTRVPHQLVVRLAKKHNVDLEPIGRIALQIATDSFRTWCPLKHCFQTVAIAALELALRLQGVDVAAHLGTENGLSEPELAKWSTNRENVMEVLRDLLELYNHNAASSAAGQTFEVDTILAVRIALNQEADAHNLARFAGAPRAAVHNDRHLFDHAGNGRLAIASPLTIPFLLPTPPVSIPAGALPVDQTDPTTGTSPTEAGSSDPATSKLRASGPIPGYGTVRFLLKPDGISQERSLVRPYFSPGWEEVPVEPESESDVEMKEPDPEPVRSADDLSTTRPVRSLVRADGGGNHDSDEGAMSKPDRVDAGTAIVDRTEEPGWKNARPTSSSGRTNGDARPPFRPRSDMIPTGPAAMQPGSYRRNSNSQPMPFSRARTGSFSSRVSIVGDQTSSATAPISTVQTTMTAVVTSPTVTTAPGPTVSVSRPPSGHVGAKSPDLVRSHTVSTPPLVHSPALTHLSARSRSCRESGSNRDDQSRDPTPSESCHVIGTSFKPTVNKSAGTQVSSSRLDDRIELRIHNSANVAAAAAAAATSGIILPSVPSDCDRDTQRELERERRREKDRERAKDRGRYREKTRSRDWSVERDKARDRDRDRDRDRIREREREREKERTRPRTEDDDRERDRDRKRQRTRDHDRDRDRTRDSRHHRTRDHRDRDRDRDHRDGDKDHRDGEKDHRDRPRRRGRELDRDRDRDRGRENTVGRSPRQDHRWDGPGRRSGSVVSGSAGPGSSHADFHRSDSRREVREKV